MNKTNKNEEKKPPLPRPYCDALFRPKTKLRDGSKFIDLRLSCPVAMRIADRKTREQTLGLVLIIIYKVNTFYYWHIVPGTLTSVNELLLKGKEK